VPSERCSIEEQSIVDLISPRTTCNFCFFTHIFTGDFNFKGLIARRLYKSFGVKCLIRAFCWLKYGLYGNALVNNVKLFGSNFLRSSNFPSASGPK
jgi:hypothetical protein